MSKLHFGGGGGFSRFLAFGGPQDGVFCDLFMVFHLEHRKHQNNEVSQVCDTILRVAEVLSGGWVAFAVVCGECIDTLQTGTRQ
mgnify:CR=1 FL=1